MGCVKPKLKHKVLYYNEKYEYKPTSKGPIVSEPIALTDDNFSTEVLKASLPVLVDFWATWCGPCRAIAPIVQELSREYEGRAKVCKLDVDTAEKTAAEFGIRSIPTLLIFKEGKVADQIIGVVAKAQITEKLEAALA